MLEPAGARCAKHPEALAVAPCSRCGTFLCGACTELVREEAFCADCVEWLRRNGSPSRGVQGLIALGVVGILGFPVCLFLAPVVNLVAAVACLLGATRELRRIRRGEGPLRGLRQAKVARVLGAVNLVLALLWIAAFVYGLFYGYAWGRSASK
jgi:hypothetical protein